MPINTTTPTNEQRSARALGALTYYKGSCLYESGPAGSEEDVTDLLTDLRHYCARNKIDFEHLANISHAHYCEEK